MQRNQEASIFCAGYQKNNLMIYPVICLIHYFEANFLWKETMENRPQNTEFRNNSENFHPCEHRDNMNN